MSDKIRRRYHQAATAAASLTLMLSLGTDVGALYLYIFRKFNGHFPANSTIVTGGQELMAPSASDDQYQEVFLLLGAAAYTVWAITAVLLLRGITSDHAKYYVPWLVWSGIMELLCLFGIIHNISYNRNIYLYVLAEYVVMVLTIILTLPLSCVVYTDYTVRKVKSSRLTDFALWLFLYRTLYLPAVAPKV